MIKQMLSEPVLLALINVVVGGVVLKIAEFFIQKNKSSTDDMATFRKELREEVTYLRKEVQECQTDLENWRMKYYDLLDKCRLHINTKQD